VEVPNYVMVPVPEQLVPRVMQHVLGLMMLDSIEDWEQDELNEHFSSMTEDRKAIVVLCANAVVSGRAVTADAVAEKLQLPLSHVMKAIRDLAEQARELSRPQIVQVRMTTGTSPTGREVKRREVQMDEGLGKMVLEAEQADIASDGGHPEVG
jgi:hypothetical protein